MNTGGWISKVTSVSDRVSVRSMVVSMAVTIGGGHYVAGSQTASETVFIGDVVVLYDLSVGSDEAVGSSDGAIGSFGFSFSRVGVIV